MTENPTKKRDLSLLSHFSLILPSLSVEARVGSCDVLVSRRFCLAFLLFGLWDLPIRLPFFGPRPRPPLQNTPSLRLIVQSRSNPRLRLLSQKKKKSRIGQSVSTASRLHLLSPPSCLLRVYHLLSGLVQPRLYQQLNGLSRDRARHGLLVRGSDRRHNLIVFHMSSIQSCWVHIDFCE